MKEVVKTEAEIRKERKKEYNKLYYQLNRGLWTKYNKKYYRKNKEKLLDKRAKKSPSERKCKWCKRNIAHVRPRHKEFCNNRHAKLYAQKRKKIWRKRRGKVSPLPYLQCPKVPSRWDKGRDQASGGASLPTIQESSNQQQINS